jgi:hypothetical protein
MSKTVIYKTYTIRSIPLQLLAPGQWKIEIYVAWERAGIVSDRPFSLAHTYQTEEEADLHGITFGQRIIDGKVPGLSVN